MRELFWPLHRSSGPQAQGLHFSYEKAGLVVKNEPIPWNAEAVLVEALVRFPTGMVRRKTDFHLHVPGHPPLTAVTLHRHEQQQDGFRLLFRLPPLQDSTMVELHWRSSVLGQAALPLLTAEEFVRGLQIQSPTVFVRLGKYNVPCRSFVVTQSRGLLAGGLLTSPTGLLPLIDLEASVEFIDHRTEQKQTVPIRLTSSQLTAKEALLSIAPERRPRRLGTWTVQWTIAGRELARTDLRVISQRTFRNSLYLAESRYVYQDKQGVALLGRVLPSRDGIRRLGPCFLVASRESGVAALCPLEVRVQLEGGGKSAPSSAEEVLVTDGPSLFLPGTIAIDDLKHVTAFELLSRGAPLGPPLSMCPTPMATFTSEGGFKPMEEYAWTSITEEELSDRLGKLLELPHE